MVNQKSSPTWRRFAAPATLVVGLTAGAFLTPIGLASAQEEEEPAAKTNPVEEERQRKVKGIRSQVVADITDISVEIVEQGYAEGHTPTEIAEKNGSSREYLVAGLLELAEDRIEIQVDQASNEDENGGRKKGKGNTDEPLEEEKE